MTNLTQLTLPADIQSLLDQAAGRAGVPLRLAPLNRSDEAAVIGREANVIPFRRIARPS